jgi:hypothetical protein
MVGLTIHLRQGCLHVKKSGHSTTLFGWRERVLSAITVAFPQPKQVIFDKRALYTKREEVAFGYRFFKILQKLRRFAELVHYIQKDWISHGANEIGRLKWRTFQWGVEPLGVLRFETWETLSQSRMQMIKPVKEVSG